MKKIFIFISYCLGVIGFIDTSHATPYMEKHYPNLYVEGVTFGDIYKSRRLMIRQTRLTGSPFFGCKLSPVPTISYLFRDTNPRTNEPKYEAEIHWLFSCNSIKDKVIQFPIVISGLRRGNYEYLFMSAFKDVNDSFSHTLESSYVDFVTKKNTSRDEQARYYITKDGIFLAYRNKQGVITRTENMWWHGIPQGVSDSVSEFKAVKKSIGETWYESL